MDQLSAKVKLNDKLLFDEYQNLPDTDRKFLKAYETLGEMKTDNQFRLGEVFNNFQNDIGSLFKKKN